MPSGDSEKVDRRRSSWWNSGGAVVFVEGTLKLKTATVVHEGFRRREENKPNDKKVSQIFVQQDSFSVQVRIVATRRCSKIAWMGGFLCWFDENWTRWIKPGYVYPATRDRHRWRAGNNICWFFLEKENKSPMLTTSSVKIRQGSFTRTGRRVTST